MLKYVKILIVDDEPENRTLLQMLLKHFGANVEVAGGTFEALRRFEKFRPDLMISDIDMPDVNGFGLLLRLRALEKQRGLAPPTPVIALTGFAGRDNKIQVLRAGFAAYFSKPYDPGKLVECIKSIVRSNHISVNFRSRRHL